MFSITDCDLYGVWTTPFYGKIIFVLQWKEVASSNKIRVLQKAWIFWNIFRFINDLCSFNKSNFENNYTDIYPDKLELKKENEDRSKASLFDLLIEVHNRKFTTDLLIKENFFPFISNIFLLYNYCSFICHWQIT